MSTLLDTQTRGHHPNSPSSLQSSEACAHFVNASSGSAAADAGVLQHKAAETRDLSILEDHSHIDAVKRALILEDSFITYLTIDGIPPEVVREKYLPVDKDHIEIDSAGFQWAGVTGGYPDTIVISRECARAAVLDWKFGKQWVTPTRDNMQGKAYAAGVFEEYPFVNVVDVVFYHPHLEVDQHGNPAPLDEYRETFLRENLSEIQLQIKVFVARKKLAQKEGLNNSCIPQTPKTDLCLWCANKATCKPLGQLMVLAASKHKAIEVPESFDPSNLSKPEDYASAYRFANQFEAVAKEIKRYVTDAVKREGVEVPGFALLRRREPEVVDPSKLKQIAIEMYGVAESDFEKCVSVPITKIDALIKEKAGKGAGASAVRGFRESLEAAGALVMGEGYLYLKEEKERKAAKAIPEAVVEKDLDI